MFRAAPRPTIDKRFPALKTTSPHPPEKFGPTRIVSPSELSSIACWSVVYLLPETQRRMFEPRELRPDKAEFKADVVTKLAKAVVSAFEARAELSCVSKTTRILTHFCLFDTRQISPLG